jgi:carboxylesterase type B
MLGSVSSYGAVENLVALAGGDVIVVAVSYRLNAFGFLALEELTKVDPRGTSGNMGITVTS